MTWTDLRLRIRGLVYRARVEEELGDELEFHLAMAGRKYEAAGHSPEEAARRARLDFGRLAAAQGDCRDVRGTQTVEAALRDIRYALRSFRRTPGFVFTVAGTIALGLGLNTALFTLFNAYVLRPLSVRDPYSLYTFTWTNQAGEGHAFTWGEYRDLAGNSPAWSEVAATEGLFARLEGRPLQGLLVSGNYFPMLGVGTALGRPLLPEDAAAPGRDPYVVISYQLWQSMFAGRPDVLGAKIIIRGCAMQVIGVARQGFQGLTEAPQDFWAPVTMASRLQDGPDLFGAESPERLSIVGRIRRGESLRSAEASLAVWSRRMTRQLPPDRRAVGVLVRSKASAIPLTRELLMVFSPLAAAFGLVLLLACTNVASMMLARAMARQREIGIRLSLGAARGRLIRQLLTESVLLSVPAALLGFVIARITIDGAMRIIIATVPKDMLDLIHTVDLPVDGRVIAFMIAAALASSFLFGLAPAVQATRVNLVPAARGEFGSALKPVRLRNAIVTGQIAVSTMLLVACGALVRTTIAMSTFDIGFRTGGVIAMEILEKGRRQVVEALSADPEVTMIAAASSVPMGGLVPGGTASVGNGTAIHTAQNYVSPEYFGMLGIPILRGRNFSTAEAVSQAPVAILSAAAAERLAPRANLLGQVVHLEGKPDRDVRIIGVAGDIVTCCIAYGKDSALLYLPVTPALKGSLLVSVHGNVEAVRRRMDARLATAAPGAVEDIHSLDQYRAVAVYPFEAASLIGFAVGGLALLLTASGIYGVVSYLVTQRTREIGIRMALGATAGSVAGLIMKQSLRRAAIGIGLGAASALGLSRILGSGLVFVRNFDVPAFGAGILLVLCAALAAGFIPSRRAARVDPTETLRYD